MDEIAGNSSSSASSLAERIRRVEYGLALPRVLRSEAPQTASIWERLEYYDVPGISVAVINDFRVEWAKGYGIREAGGPHPVTSDTLFQAGSISKPVTAAAVLRLVQDKLLDLDEDVSACLVSWKIPRNGAWQPRVTLRHLLCHAGGLTVHLLPGFPRDHPLPSLRQILEGVKPAKNWPVRVNMVPSLQYGYSSGGYAVLQQLLIDVTMLSFPELMRHLVLEPLGMTRSTFEQPLPQELWSVAASGHRNGGQPVGGQWFVYPAAAQGGLWTTPSDLARFASALQHAKAGKSNAFLARDLVDEMLSPQVDGHVGLGVFLEGKGESARFSHLGGNEGFSSKFLAFCSAGIGAIVMTNWHYGFLVDEVLEAIAREYAWPGSSPEILRAVEIDPATYGAYVGDYETPSGTRVRITLLENALHFEAPGQQAIELRPKSEVEFFMNEAAADVVFERADSGTVAGLRFRQDGRDTPARKIG